MQNLKMTSVEQPQVFEGLVVEIMDSPIIFPNSINTEMDAADWNVANEIPIIYARKERYNRYRRLSDPGINSKEIDGRYNKGCNIKSLEINNMICSITMNL